MAKFCLECGVRLPLRSGFPENPTLPQLPLPLVAREEDLNWLEDRLQRVKTSVVGARIVGEPGAGKTRLLRELLAHARAEGDIAVLTGPDPFYAEVAYYAVREAVRELAHLNANDIDEQDYPGASSEAQAGLSEIFSGAPRDDVRSPGERRRAIAEALRWAMLRAAHRAGEKRVILAIDDLYRIDGASRNAFADAVGEPPHCPALVICAHIPGFDSGWGADAAARVIGGLPPPAVARLLRPGRSVPRDVPEDTRGVLPMYLEQVLRYTQDGGSDPPSRLADLVALRLDTLEPSARRALQALAVIGDQMKPATVADLLPKTENFDAILGQLSRAGMIEIVDGRISTSHPLIREIVLAGIPATARKELHGRALRACEAIGAPIEARAQHAFYAGDSFQALLLLEQVAERATARGDTATEVLALRRGLEVARQEIARGELDDPLRAVLIFGRKLGASLTRAGNFADTEGVLREALDVAGPSGTDRARVLSALAHVAHGRRRTNEAISYIDQAIEVARQSGARDLLSAFADTRRAWA